MPQFFENLLKSVDLTAALRLANTLQVQELEGISECKVHDITLPRIERTIVEDEIKLLVIL